MMLRYLAALVLGIGLLTPVTVCAQDHAHVWSDNENPHWQQYLKEHHKKFHEWAKATKTEQRAYWKWRDAHPDAH